MNHKPRESKWSKCLAGREPAESLDTAEREQLVGMLLGLGWPVANIAYHTKMTEYTTNRICSRIRAQWAWEQIERVNRLRDAA